LMRGQIRNTKT